MTGAEIITLFESLVDDTLDAVLELQLANLAIKKVEARRPWSFLKKLDSSQSATTSAITLPSDYRRTLFLRLLGKKLTQIPFEQQDVLSSLSGCWYLDSANGTYYLTGTPPSGTLKHFYLKKTTAITTATSPVWPDFHELIAYEMAEDFFAIDQADRSRSWDDKHAMKKQLIERAMIDWDVELEAQALENGQYTEQSQLVDVADGIM